MTTTRCKFRCDCVTLLPGGAKNVEFSAVTSGSEENKAFWAWTPGGKSTFYTINEAVEFTPGQEYYLDLTAAPMAVVGAGG